MNSALMAGEPRRVLITGANGFVGRHLIAYLLDSYGSGVSVFAGVRPQEVEDPGILPSAAGWSGRKEPGVDIIALDVQNFVQVRDAIQHVRPDQIVHLAARSSGADTDREAISAVNVDGTRNILEAAAMLSPYPRALVVSTGYVYGNTDPARPGCEEDQLGPPGRYGPYADSKIEMESVVQDFRAFAVLTRPFSHTGPGQTSIFALPGFARQLARIEQGLEPPILRVGNLSARRDLLDVRDVVRAYSALLTAGEPGKVYNVATGAPLVIGDVVDQLRFLCRVRTQVEVDTTRLRPADIACSSGNPLRLRTATSWTPEYPLDTTLRDTLDYWRSQTQ